MSDPLTSVQSWAAQRQSDALRIVELTKQLVSTDGVKSVEFYEGFAEGMKAVQERVQFLREESK